MKQLLCLPTILFSLSFSVADLACYHGSSSDDKLTNQTCSVLCSSPASTSSPVKYCATFKVSSKSTYFCDCENKCSSGSVDSSLTSFTSNATINGTQGALSCCSGNLCNTRTPAPDVPDNARHIQCLVGNFSSNSQQQCVSSWCIEKTVIRAAPGLTVRPLSCDDRSECAFYNIPNNHCQLVNDSSVKLTTRLCCCSSRDGCNADFTAASLVPLSTLDPPTPAPADLKHWMFIGGTLAGVMFGLLVFLLVAVVIKRLKQKRSTQLTYTYAQLTEDLAADERDADDERMIVA